MKYGIMGALIPVIMDKVIYGYTAEALPEVDIKQFRKAHHKEYRNMVARTESIGSSKENMFASTLYIAMYGFSYYKAAPDKITDEIFIGMIDTLGNSALFSKAYKGKDAFEKKRMDRYEKGAKRSQKGEYPMDWKFDFRQDMQKGEYFIDYSECGICKLGQKEGVFHLVKYMCKLDYVSLELMGAKLIRTKTIGDGFECCDFHVMKG